MNIWWKNNFIIACGKNFRYDEKPHKIDITRCVWTEFLFRHVLHYFQVFVKEKNIALIFFNYLHKLIFLSFLLVLLKIINFILNKDYTLKILNTLYILAINYLSKSESVKFSLIESVICLFTESSLMETIFFTVKSVNFHCFISENNIFYC